MNMQRRRAEQISTDGSGSVVERARLASEQLSTCAEAADVDARLSSDALLAIRERGLIIAPFPVAFGGEGLIGALRVADLCSVLRLLGAGDLSVARVFEGHVNAVALVCRFGREDQVGVLAEQVATGSLSGVWGAEDAQGLQATSVNGGWRLEGRKILASGAGLIRCPVVTASSPDGQILCLLDFNQDQRVDLSRWTAQGMRSSATGTVDLSGIVVPASRIIGTPGDFMRQPHFSGGAWRFCAVHLGAMERLVDLFQDHLIARHRDSDPYQLQRVAHCIAATASARFWIERSARLLAAEDETSESIVAHTNLTRMVTERAALDVMEAIQRGVGLGAFIRPNPIERVSRDLSTYLRQPVPDMAMAHAASAILASGVPTRDLWASSRES